MLDYRFHYAILATEDRVNSRQRRAPSRTARRVFRLAGVRSALRDGER